MLWSNAAINSLLDLVDCPKGECDPLAMKQAISTLQPELSSLKLKQRKAVQLALEAQLQAAAKRAQPTRLYVEAPATPVTTESSSQPRATDPAPAAGTEPRTPRGGTEAGYEWTQSEAELTLTVLHHPYWHPLAAAQCHSFARRGHANGAAEGSAANQCRQLLLPLLLLQVPLPEGTSKSDVVLQMTPRFGPAQTLVLRARFWPLPLLCGELCGQVEAATLSGGGCNPRRWRLQPLELEVAAPRTGGCNRASRLAPHVAWLPYAGGGE